MATFNLGSQLTLDIFLYRNSLAFGNYLDSASRVSLVTFHWLSLTFNLIGLLFTLVGNRNYMKVTILRFHCHAINTAQKNTFETVQWKKPRK